MKDSAARRFAAFFIVASAMLSYIPACMAVRLSAEAPAPFVLARDGQPQATIVVARDATRVAAFAARELQYHVERITGAPLPIARDPDSR